MNLRFGISLSLLCAGFGGCTVQPRSALFCKQEKYDFSILAARTLPGGDLQFGLSKWEDDFSFTLYGVAERKGSGWIYERHDSDYTYSPSDQDWLYTPHNPFPQLTCKVWIEWRGERDLQLTVDEIANCPGHAGAGFVTKSTHLVAVDYRRPVTFELDDSDTFLSKRTAQGC